LPITSKNELHRRDRDPRPAESMAVLGGISILSSHARHFLFTS
jgi:hypothetical protein